MASVETAETTDASVGFGGKLACFFTGLYWHMYLLKCGSRPKPFTSTYIRFSRRQSWAIPLRLQDMKRGRQMRRKAWWRWGASALRKELRGRSPSCWLLFSGNLDSNIARVFIERQSDVWFEYFPATAPAMPMLLRLACPIWALQLTAAPRNKDFGAQSLELEALKRIPLLWS